MNLFRRFKRFFKKKKQSKFNDLDNVFLKRANKIMIERFAAHLRFSEACRNGFYCIKCKEPFQDIGIAFVCVDAEIDIKIWHGEG